MHNHQSSHHDDLHRHLMRGRIERSRAVTALFLALFHLPARLADSLRGLMQKPETDNDTAPRDFRPTRL